MVMVGVEIFEAHVCFLVRFVKQRAYSHFGVSRVQWIFLWRNPSRSELQNPNPVPAHMREHELNEKFIYKQMFVYLLLYLIKLHILYPRCNERKFRSMLI
jgi:hypothetical protein